MLCIRLINGHWATLHGVLTEPGMTGSVSVIIGPTSREHLAPLKAAIHGLTPREQQVAELILRGHATPPDSPQARNFAVHGAGAPAPHLR
jgi:hypothetical protein